jgi:DegV family protein with EDD domain
MKPIAIVTDSGCDLAPDLLRRHGIVEVPLVVRFGAQVFDDTELEPDAFWRKVAESDAVPQTSQPSPGVFEEAFRPLVEAGKHVLCLVVTSKHSGTWNAAHIAARRFPGDVTIHDSLSLSLGQGYQVLVAARAVRAGRTVDQVTARLRSVARRTQLFISLDTVEFLKRGGRASRLMPLFDRVLSTLRIRPLLHMTDGELGLLGVARSRRAAVARIRDAVREQAPLEQIVVAHTRLAESGTALAEELAQAAGYPREKVLCAEAGAVLACHAGPGVIAAGTVRAADGQA